MINKRLVQSMCDFPDVKKLPNLVCLDFETLEDGGVEGFSFAYVDENKRIISKYVPIAHEVAGTKYKNISKANVKNFLNTICSVEKRRFVFHNASFDLRVLWDSFEIKIPLDRVEDTMLLHWKLDTERRHGLKDIMRDEYNIEDIVKYKEARQSLEIFFKYGADDAKYTIYLWHRLFAEAQKNKKTYECYRKYEIPFIEVMKEMNYTRNFVRIDYVLLKKYIKYFNAELNLVTTILKDKLGDINFNSTHQLGPVLEKRGYKVPKNEDTGNYSLPQNTLEKMHSRQGGVILDVILYYRSITKNSGTYVYPLIEKLEKVKEDVYILSGYSFNHIGTRTGRLSGVNPNLQNQPKDPLVLRMLLLRELHKRNLFSRRKKFISDDDIYELNKSEDVIVKKLIKECSVDIRTLFIAMPGRKFIGADYNQLELRMMAHLSKDKFLVEAYQKGLDLHQDTADRINAILKEKVLDRGSGKTMNFAMQYGSWYASIAESLGCKLSVAKQIYEAYREIYSGRTKFVSDLQKSARISHYVQTILGTRRNMKTLGITNNDSWISNHARNACVSTVVSGSSSDLIKVAMLNIYKIKEVDIKIQVHDELLIEVDEKIVDKMAKKIKYEMENAIKFDNVPIVAEVKIGDNWRVVH